MRLSGIESNDELVDYLVERGYIKSEKVEHAFRNVDRKDFVPDGGNDNAYVDMPLSLAEGSTISAPHMVAINTELLDVDEDSKVVEIGSGSGYQVAILSELADEVVGVEIIEELVEKSRERLSDRSSVEIRQGDGLKAVSGEFDRILYSCAVESFDEAKNYLREGGVAVAPVYADGTQVLEKYQNGEVTEHGRVGFVPKKEPEE